MTQLIAIWREAWKPPDRRPPWAWAEEHIHAIPYSPVPGRFRADNSPWLKEPLEALVDPKVRIVSIIAAIQSSKTTIGEIGLCYIIANLPGPALWLDQTDDDARDQSESRLQMVFDECPPVRALYPRNRHKLKTATKHFSNGMTLWVLGAAAQPTVRYCFGCVSLRMAACVDLLEVQDAHIGMDRGPVIEPENDKRAWEKVWVESWHFDAEHKPRPMKDYIHRGNQILLRELVAAIEHDTEPTASLRDAVFVTEIIQGAYASHFAGGKRVTIPLSDRRHPLEG